ncbi:hypothetical protein K4L44_10270 [Halosquirtibacter laminarini]|uniref:Uncharacterized protein n=1 Tax=Halosquirtibacter laminarini TaxID=3374600 RepID=A0AC61NBU9_9BACT|nr:hypothetical protein K4L44_10270 [Prolixibacteraceae bacterium]
MNIIRIFSWIFITLFLFSCTKTEENTSSIEHYINVIYDKNVAISSQYNSEELGPHGYKHKVYYNNGYLYYGTTYNELDSKGSASQLLKINAETGDIENMVALSSWGGCQDMVFYSGKIITAFSGYTYTRVMDQNTLKNIRTVKGNFTDVDGETNTIPLFKALSVFDNKIILTSDSQNRAIVFDIDKFTEAPTDGVLLVAESQIGTNSESEVAASQKSAESLNAPFKSEVIGNYLLIADKDKINVYDRNLTLVNSITKIKDVNRDKTINYTTANFDFAQTSENSAFMKFKSEGKYYLMFFNIDQILEGDTLSVFYCESNGDAIIDASKAVNPITIKNKIISNDNEGGVNYYDISEFKVVVE